MIENLFKFAATISFGTLKRLEEKLDNLEGRVIGIETVLGEIRDTIVKDREKRQTQLITWGVAIIGSLATAVAVLSYRLFI